MLHLFSPCCSAAKPSPTVCDPMNFGTPGFPVLHYLPEFAQTHVHRVSDTLQPSHPLLPPASESSNESARCISGQSIGTSASASVFSNEYSGLISFKTDWFDLLAVQGILKSLRQHHSLKASILRYSAFFMVQLSHLYMSTVKTTALTILPTK